MGYGHHGFPFFGLLFAGVFFVFLITRILFFRRHGRWCMHGIDHRMDAELILRRRLASGEIGEEEFLRIKETLSK